LQLEHDRAFRELTRERSILAAKANESKRPEQLAQFPAREAGRWRERIPVLRVWKKDAE
jgi:hypothetical protein